jgi:hypothetical protein
MIIYTLLFIIILIYIFEIYRELSRLSEYYLTDFNKSENFVDSTARNPNHYPPPYKCPLSTPRFKEFAPLIYEPSRRLHYNRQWLNKEGELQDMITESKIKEIKAKYDAETDPEIKAIYERELKLHDWRAYPFQLLDNRGNLRGANDVLTDYDYQTFGNQRIWLEPHDHLTNYMNRDAYPGWQNYPIDHPKC